MNIRTQKTIASLLLILWAFETSLVRADVPVTPEKEERGFIELVRNTKEAKSILLVQDEVTEAKTRFPPTNGEIQRRLQDAFTSAASTLKPDETACEPLIFSRLQDSLKTEGLSSEPMAVRQALLLLREKDFIDDVTLLPLLASYSTWEDLGYRPEEWIRKDSEGRTLQIDCPTDQFLRLIKGVKDAKGPRAKRKEFRKRIEAMAKERNDHGENRYLPVQIKWLKALNENRYDKNSPFSLPNAVMQLDGAKDSFPGAHPEGDTPSRVISKRKKKSGGLSNRLALYGKYDALQIRMLSELFENFRHQFLELKPTVISLEYRDGSPTETYSLSDEEQYRMIAKILHKNLTDLKTKPYFSGKNPTFDEVVIAAVETGAVRGDELEAAMGVEDVWNPKVSFWLKATNVAKKYGSTSLLLVPPPISFWAALVLTLGETIASKKFQKPANPDDSGTSIF